MENYKSLTNKVGNILTKCLNIKPSAKHYSLHALIHYHNAMQ